MEIDKKVLWESILTSLGPIINKSHILSFFKDSIILEIQNGQLLIGVSSVYAFNFIKDRYEARLLQAARQIIPEINQLKIEIKGALMDEEHPLKPDLNLLPGFESKNVRKVPNKQEILMEGGLRSKMFNPKYTLDNFISGNENRLPHAACMAAAAKPGGIYNPLFLYGDVGLGKTHLLQGTGLEILKNYPSKNVVYMTSERFINEIIEAIGKKHTKSFKDRYRKVDCLIVDDIQFFGNKASSQQEFFHTFNELYDAGKQIIISSDRPPKDLDELEERLTSRFGMGMVVEVNVPGYETRLAILNAKCREYEVLIDKEVLEFIAYNVTHSIRGLEGILVNAIAESQLTDTTPTIRTVAEAIRKLNKSDELKGYSPDMAKTIVIRSPDDVIDIVSNYFKLTKSDLMGEDRRKEVMIPRQICMYLIREMLNHSYETIGENFGGRNHTTVLHAVNKIIEQMQGDERVKRDINALKKEMGV